MNSYFIGGLIILLLFFIELYRDHNCIQVTKYTVRNKKIQKAFKGYQIVQLSDLHGTFLGKNNEKLIQLVQKINPDIIVMTGDMINGRLKNDTESLLALIQNLSKTYPIYYIRGNHEMYLAEKQQKKIETMLKQHQVYILNNEKVVIQKESAKINLFGMWCDIKYYRKVEGEKRFFTDQVLKEKMKQNVIEEDTFNILLAHNPNFIEAYANWGADLTLSGHIHGGMVRLPLIGGVFSPDTLFFPKYSKGRYVVNGKELIVNCGLSRGARGFRLFNRPEIVLIELETEE